MARTISRRRERVFGAVWWKRTPMPGAALAWPVVFHMTSPVSSRRRPWGSSLLPGGVKPSSSRVPTGSGVSVRMKMPIDEMSVMYA